MAVRPLFLTLVLMAAACGDGNREAEGKPRLEPGETAAAPAAGARPDSAAAPGVSFATDTVPVRRPRPGAPVATLRAMRTAAHPGYVRVVFDFGSDPLPGYVVQAVHSPVHHCASGEPVPVTGVGLLEVKLDPAQAHDDEGRPTLTNRAERPNMDPLQEIRLTCDFEAQVMWALGLASAPRFRVLELRDPSRLVVDLVR